MTRSEYQRYLASREWALKREAVRKRCGGICEVCKRNPMQATHHLTYERVGNELLEDLQGICDACHAYESGKTDETFKPQLYFAGKISKNGWRNDLIPGLRQITQIGENLDCGSFVYGGPWFVGCDHGCFHGPNSHGCRGGCLPCIDEDAALELNDIPMEIGTLCEGATCQESFSRPDIWAVCLSAIRRCDALVAWIDSPDCYGTIYEIAFAVTERKPCALIFATEELMNDMWFIRQSRFTQSVYAENIKDNLQLALNLLRFQLGAVMAAR